MGINDKSKAHGLSFRHLIIGVVIVLIVGLIVFFVGRQWFFTDDQGKEKVIEQVLNEQFSTADEALIRLIESPENATILDGTTNAMPEEHTALNAFLEEKYGAYFTEEMYQEYLTTYAFMYQVPAYYSNYPLQTTEISLEKNQNEDGLYNFTVNVSYGENEESLVSGRARVNDTKKLNYFEILEDDGLQQVLNN
ncbi:hypothetical protein [Paraliobacillus sediminis]|uniref:hypothetical protein n=1 Tax=Paraliobacillus sediminis TaxID=1885916 RepID=UPI000E3E31BD|nr:hypothetical protein [Paraliobacillus sediminis]